MNLRGRAVERSWLGRPIIVDILPEKLGYLLDSHLITVLIQMYFINMIIYELMLYYTMLQHVRYNVYPKKVSFSLYYKVHVHTLCTT